MPDEGPKLKDPDTFSGRDPSKLPLFITQCTHTFVAKPTRYAAERNKVLFAASYLRDLASHWWMPVISEDPPSPMLDSWALFTQELFKMFGNKHLQATSQNELLKLRMKENTRVTEYLVEFNSHAVYTGWNDTALGTHFYRGLAERLKEAFQYVERRPETFEELRDLALNFDQRYWERQEELGKKPSSGKEKKDENKPSDSNPHNESNQPSQPSSNSRRRRRNKNPEKSQTATPSSNTTSQPSTTTSATNTTKSTSGPASSDNPHPRGPLAPEERERRKTLGLCFYCGKSGHTYHIHKRQPQQPQQQQTTSARPQTGRAVVSFVTKAPAEPENQSPAQTKEAS